MRSLTTLALALAALPFVTHARALADDAPKAGERVFELRTYYTFPGRLDALNARFRDHTCALFKKHGMELVGFWTPQEEKDGKSNTLVYLLAFPSREAAAASWKAFAADPEWKAAREASEKDGKIVERVTSVYLDPTDYSAIK
ncbi:MAG: NIPSNAP family protein [Isosphaeraceae bacterium]